MWAGTELSCSLSYYQCLTEPGTVCALNKRLCVMDGSETERRQETMVTRQDDKGVGHDPGGGWVFLVPGANSERQREEAQAVVFGRQAASSPRPTLTITDLTHRGKSNQRHTGITRLHDIETLSFG